MFFEGCSNFKLVDHETLEPQAADLALKMVPEGVKVHLTDFKSVLSVDEHNLLVKKLIAQFEMNVAALPTDAARSTSLAESWVRFCFLCSIP